MDDAVEIRILGVLSVRRRDGTPVAHGEWRTSKTRDLLRILALHAGAPVPADRLIETLWPDVEPAKGRGSLRMAVSQIRQVIGKDCVVREFDGLALQHAWVDAAVFSSLAGDARRLFGQGALTEGLTTACEATALYGGDLCSDEPYAEWAFADREALRTLRVTLLAEAAEAAVALGRHRTAVHLAGQAVDSEPANERAHRVLMRAHSRLGETDRALGAYERCREALADALGADPAPETRALHLELLSTDPTEDVRVRFVGRDAEMKAIQGRITDSLREGQPAVVLVSGDQGSGRTRLADEACSPWSDRLVTLCSGTGDGQQQHPLAECLRAVGAPTVVRVDGPEWEDTESLERLRAVLTGLAGPVAIVATTTPVAEAPREFARIVRALEAHGQAVEVPVGALPREAVDDLLAQLLTERAAPSFLEDVMGETGGYPAHIVQLVRDLTAAGQLTVTRNGFARLAPEATGAQDAEGVVQRVRAGLAPSQVPVFDVISVLEGPFPADDVAGICGHDAEEVRAVLDGLVDQGLLTVAGDQYRFREPGVADAAYSWLRQSTRRELHAAVAASPGISEAARVEHWDAAGQPALAFAAALDAATDAAAQGEYERQRAHALRARGLLDPSDASPRDRLAAAESLGDACHGLARFAEARGALEEAVSLAQAHAPGELARVSRKLGDVANRQDPSEALGRYRKALTEPAENPVERVRTTSAIGAMLALRSPVAAADALRHAADMADEIGDVAAQVEARVLLATHALAPMRRFADCDQGVREALALADTGEDGALLAEGLLGSKQATIALGSSSQTAATLRRADDLAGQAGEPSLARDAQLLLALTAHELGLAEFAWRWAASWDHAARVPSAGLWWWVPARVLFERGHLTHAEEALARSRWGDQGAFNDQMVRLPAARVAAERGNVEQAVELLTTAVDRAAETGVTMALPESAARLAALEATDDPAGAAARLDQAEAALGETVFAREQTAIMLARAALLTADGRWQAAADMAGAAGAASRAAGLVFGHAEALTTQARYLATAGDQPRAVTALQRAGELYADADAPARLRITSDLARRLGLDWEPDVAARGTPPAV